MSSSDNNTIPLEPGLCVYFEHEEEFSARNYTVDKVAAVMYELGRMAGRYEIKKEDKNDRRGHH